MKSKGLVVIAAAAAIGIGGYWWASPYLALDGMRTAAKEKDADRFNSYVDFEKVRISMKSQFQARMLKNMGDMGSSTAERTGAGLGAMLGMALADKMIETLVSPQMIMMAMNQAKLPKPGGDSKAEDQSAEPCMDWKLKKSGLDRAVVEVGSKCKSQGTISLVLDRSGFTTWKLTEIRLPD